SVSSSSSLSRTNQSNWTLPAIANSSGSLSLSSRLDGSHIQRNPRPHGRTQVAALDVLALRDRWLGLDHAGDEHCGVVDQLVGREGNLSSRAVNQSCLVGAELNLTGLHFLHRFAHVEGDG